ncbi:FAD-dependent oxidoreductase, partial [Patescibacteria group bacterium]|nr:FAD-dependent oxidoreductase [Patescibacteria group bacterium]
MKIGIVGGGITGLTASWKLSQAGHQVTLYEKEGRLGGLASTFRQKDWASPLEAYPHHFFVADTQAKQLLDQLGLTPQLVWRKGHSAYFHQNEIFRLDSPNSLLAIPFLNWPEKIRTGLATAWIKLSPHWQTLAKQTAWDWTENFFGQSAAQLLWQPLLAKKFGPFSQQVNAAWLWGRIKKRSLKLGYLNGGLDQLSNRLASQITDHQGKIELNKKIGNLSSLQDQFDRVLVTTTTNIFEAISSQPNPKESFPPHLGSLCFVLALKKTFLPHQIYWLNIT